MGNHQSCRVAVRIDEPHRAHRSFVTGRVYLHAPTDKAKLSSIEGIHLVLVGQEHVEISRREDHHEYNRRVHDSEPVSERATKMLVRTEVPIVSFGGRLQSGQYEYPFRWKLPPGLPSSMRCKKKTNGGDGHILGEIRYTLSAKVVGQNSSSFAGGEGLVSDSVSVNILGDSTGLRGQPIPKQESEFPIRSCLFWQKGEIRLGWEANSDVSYPNGLISVNVSGENQSQVPVKTLCAKLIETVSICPGRLDRTGLERSITQTVAKKKIAVDEMACWMPHRDPDGLLSEHETQSSTINLRVPNDVRDSYLGDLIQVRHTLTIIAETPGFLCTSPESSYQVHIASEENEGTYVASIPPPPENPDYQSSTQYAEAEFLPEDWKPVVADDVVCIPEASAVLVDEGLRPSGGGEADQGSYADAAAAASATSVPTEGASAPNDKSSFVVPPNRRPPAMAPTVPGLHEIVETRPETLSAAMNDSAWATLVQNLSPREFCSTVQRAGPQAPSVARALALTMGSSLQTRHLLACLYALPDATQRMEVMRQIASLVSDLSSNMSVIEQELSRDELVHFRAALQR